MRALISKVHSVIHTLYPNVVGAMDWAPTPSPEQGDFAIPCFKISKSVGKKPTDIAQEIATALQKSLDPLEFTKFEAMGPYVNVSLNTAELYDQLLDAFQQDRYLQSQEGHGRSIVVDFSSPNVAKEIALHHLRSTAIGNALCKIAKLRGYRVVALNYLGDWGTSFGKLLLGFERYGDSSKLESGGLQEMLRIYVAFNQAEKQDPALSEQAKAAFQKLENGDPAYRALWQRFRDLSVREFQKLYSRLGIEFDSFDGESLYIEDLKRVIAEVDAKIGTRISDGALVCELAGHKVPILLKKDDGASLYLTRDLSAIEDRWTRYNFECAWYVVAVQQKLHFEQLFGVVQALDKPYSKRAEHISFGMLSFGQKTMKSRDGNVIFLRDVLDEAKSRALEIIKEKNPSLPDPEGIAEQIGIGAVLFYDLSQHRNHDVSFDWDKALSFDGDTAPFVQYVHARCHSLLARGHKHLESLPPSQQDPELAAQEIYQLPAFHGLMAELSRAEMYIERAFSDRDPSQVATAALRVAKSFNQLYHARRFVDESEPAKLRLLLGATWCTQLALEKLLDCLGISAPTQM
jgi:arginyl-tRNA synthetase